MKKILITGGGGFIGSHLAERFLSQGNKVTIYESFSRKGSRDNVALLKSNYHDLKVVEGTIYDSDVLATLVRNKDVIIHTAAQTAVTSSVINPRRDFEVNALGTFNVLEAVRLSGQKPIFIFTSTNKVYGGMENVKVIEGKTNYSYKDFPYGISEKMPTDFHSPYGCSKGTADQYVHDYYRIYGIPTVVFRQSCIYGTRQFGVEDQGWVAWFMIALTLGWPIKIYGNGKQVRDILYVDDLCRAFEMAIEKISVSRGKIYNIGGGKDNSLSIWYGLRPKLEKLFGRKMSVKFSDWRPGDQKIFISDNRFIEHELGWKPKVNIDEGLEKLFNWVQDNKNIFVK